MAYISNDVYVHLHISRERMEQMSYFTYQKARFSGDDLRLPSIFYRANQLFVLGSSHHLLFQIIPQPVTYACITGRLRKAGLGQDKTLEITSHFGENSKK